MSTLALETVLTQAQQLSISDRLRLIQLLVEDLPPSSVGQILKPAGLPQLHSVTREYPIQRWDQGEYEEREPYQGEITANNNLSIRLGA